MAVGCRFYAHDGKQPTGPKLIFEGRQTKIRLSTHAPAIGLRDRPQGEAVSRQIIREKTMRKALLTSVFALGAALVASSAFAENIHMSTGSQGGSWYPLGGAIKSAFEKANPGKTMSIQPGGGIANIVGVEAGKFPVGLANSISTVDATEGRAPFKKPVKNVCNVGVLYPQWFQIVVRKDSGIKAVADFAGKRLTTQQKGHTGEQLTRELLSINKLSYKELKSVSHLGYNGSVNDMKNGNADIFTLGTALPAGAVMDLASARDILIVPVSEDVIAGFKAKNAAFKKRIVKAGSYPGVDADVPALTYDTHMIAACDYSPENIEKILETINDNLKTLAAVNKNLATLTVKEMASDLGVPYHPGAIKFYASHGISVGN